MVREKKEKLTISLSPDLMDFLRAGVESEEFSSLSHGIAFAVRKLKESRGERRA
ncbi:MAG: hypothetical protein LBJ20_02155 [Candidatus Methanoplasma sp.]|jgi:Arc/MetJ-type ribon-helix-helix transcriptional regulator|nr:hypothetical protein [Candidatus Methanoplasma sp.]